MKRTQAVFPIVLALLTVLLAGCKGRETAANNSSGASPSPSAASTANANSTVATGAQSAPPPAARLLGTYEAREVENKGVVTLISKIKTIFVFRGDGTYSRVSQVDGRTYHSDSGQFRIEGDKLVITIQLADKNMKSPPVVKTQRFTLSPDGDELKLTSVAKESTATFQRTARPAA